MAGILLLSIRYLSAAPHALVRRPLLGALGSSAARSLEHHLRVPFDDT
jgi:hypothetical protein